MTPTQAISTCFGKYIVFSARAKRPEFWWFAAFTIAGAFASFWLVEWSLPLRITQFENPAFTAMLVFLAFTVLPLIAVGRRRLTDAGLNGGLFLIPFAILAFGICIGFYDSLIANRGRQYAGLGGAIIAYGGFLLSAPIILLLCARSSRPSTNQQDPISHEVSL